MQFVPVSGVKPGGGTWNLDVSHLCVLEAGVHI